jgi:hypothetical protein
MFRCSLWAAVVIYLSSLGALPALADVTFTTDFNSDPTGQLPGGVDGRVAGNGVYHVPDNAATFGEIRAGVGLGGSQGLVVGNRGNGNDGVIDNIKTPRLAESAGEPGTNSGLNGTFSTNAVFRSEYSFRTAPAIAADIRFRSEVWGPDRDTFFGLDGSAGGALVAYAFGIDASGAFPLSPIASGLSFGSWYRLVTTLTFQPGANNDTVVYELFDSLNLLVGTATTQSWEEGQRVNGYNGGNIFAVDAMGFQARNGIVGDNAFVDNLSYSVSAVPEASAMFFAGLACCVTGAGCGARRFRARKAS